MPNDSTPRILAFLMTKPPLGTVTPTGANGYFPARRHIGGAADHLQFLRAVEHLAHGKFVRVRVPLHRTHLGHHKAGEIGADGFDALDLGAGKGEPVRDCRGVSVSSM
jgi:hypothetical protein